MEAGGLPDGRYALGGQPVEVKEKQARLLNGVLAGSVLEAQLAWDISDTFNGLMMLPNLIGVVILSPQVRACTKNYVDRVLHGKDERPMLSLIPEIQEIQEAELMANGGVDN